MKFLGIVFTSIVASVVAVSLIGCKRSQGPKPLVVSGKVTFQGSPVTEGKVTFEDPKTGYTGAADLTAEGEFKMTVPAGHYRVTVTPPMVEVGGTPDTPGELTFKDVPNIPRKYWTANTSPLECDVSQAGQAISFDLVP
ncbi:MAG: hypothetical protein ACUVQG_13635 [Thermogutta sp.]